MKTVIIVQARMTSTRLPGKVLREVMGKPLLEYQVERLRRAALADELVIATTTNDTDQPVVELCGKLALPCYRGSEDDVLSRYYKAALKYEADIVVRVTADCPLIDPEIVDQIIGFYKKNQEKYDYVSNTLKRTYPRGMDTEVFSFCLLEEACLNASDPSEREHVTPYIYWRPERFRLGTVLYHEDQSRHRWTVDQIEDFRLISNIIEAIYPSNPQFNMRDVLNLLHDHPQWIELNATVEQKKV